MLVGGEMSANERREAQCTCTKGGRVLSELLRGYGKSSMMKVRVQRHHLAADHRDLVQDPPMVDKLLSDGGHSRFKIVWQAIKGHHQCHVVCAIESTSYLRFKNNRHG